jgi:uncharacterized protein (DUF58 family)
MEKIVINEAFLQQLEILQSILKSNVAGMYGGNRKSRSFGSSSEFADYRDYMPGDDITKIDWNAYARFDKLYMKLYLDERQMHTRIYIDASRSMDYEGGGKAEQAVRLAAALAYLSVSEMDKVSVYTVRGSTVEPVISGMVGKDSFITSVGRLNEISFDGDVSVSDAIIPSGVGYGDGRTVIISDFLTDNDYESVIDYLVDKRRDVTCVQVLSRSEINPQLSGKHHLFNSENINDDYRKNIDRDISAAYKRALEYSVERIRSYCNARGGSYLFAPADRDLMSIFFTDLVNMEVLK